MTELTRQELEARAAAGDVDAMIALGSLRFKQGGEERDKALRWYDAAADAGSKAGALYAGLALDSLAKDADSRGDGAEAARLWTGALERLGRSLPDAKGGTSFEKLSRDALERTRYFASASLLLYNRDFKTAFSCARGLSGADARVNVLLSLFMLDRGLFPAGDRAAAFDRFMRAVNDGDYIRGGALSKARGVEQRAAATAARSFALLLISGKLDASDDNAMLAQTLLRLVFGALSDERAKNALLKRFPTLAK